jgi:hypothetical protein
LTDEHAFSDILDSPLKTALSIYLSPSPPLTSDKQSQYLETIDLLLRRGASMRVRTKASETEEESAKNNVLSLSLLLGSRSVSDSSSNRTLLVKLLHVGKPDAAVVEEALAICGRDPRFPISVNILSDYLRGKPICCDVCEKMSSKGDKPLKLCACRTISYCGKECQAVAWKEHKKVCGLKADGTTEALVKKKERRSEK